ncbi:MAG: methylmalonyl-CoA carboxyltransferase [Promethearchaeia archaeon]|nr:MAG: methylmalonyl-CoA carboxyltransferase [Candidatus Lokiarchaeia archaeon]
MILKKTKKELDPSLVQLSSLDSLRRQSLNGGGSQKIENQHKKGKLTARERIELLVDPGTFIEIDEFVMHRAIKFDMQQQKYLGDGVVTGFGLIHGRKVFIYSQDFTVMGGSLGNAHASKISKIMDLAIKNGCPIIGLLDSGGARIQEGVDSLAGFGEIFHRNVQASGVVPQISVILGSCAGGAVYSPALTDFIIMGGNHSYMFVTGPQVVESVTNEKVSFEELGGKEIHGKTSGVAHLTTATEEQALDLVKILLSYLPSNNLMDPPINPDFNEPENSANLNNLIPKKENEPYDMIIVIKGIVDENSFFEIFPQYAPNIITGFARLEGNSIGIIANQPLSLGGAIDFHASDKSGRFIRFCDAFNIPLITLVDVPGFMPGVNQEHAGIIRHGAKMIYAYAEASVPKITIITRKAYGGAYIVMASKHLGADMNFAWNTAQIAVMGAEGACKILYRKKIKASPNPKIALQNYITAYKQEFSNPYQVAELGYVDKVIYPSETRSIVINSLKFLTNKRENVPKRKHGVFPV